ncbi:MAG: hypothetical protein IAA96_08955 [Spirochaetes bacterium]|uniref:Uncharacterized protein n=1 Tax=Candidatus Avitreponema avistercoris TaxID=2840705 RepID=A0A9D9HEG9_9SPIR|nr:hypothetical protein [Candidatus Avitreponema avistercoris]
MMAGKKDTFDELVKSLAVTERREMLDRLADLTEVESAIAEAVPDSSGKVLETVSAEKAKKIRLSDETFFIRRWFRIRAFFSSSSAEDKYNEFLVAELGRKLDKKYGTYVSIARRMYTDSMYQDFVFLETTRAFFLGYLNEYEKRQGDFYILLSTLIAPQSARAISTALDPFSESYEQDVQRDVRSSFLRKMDAAFGEFSADERARMYQAAQAAQWLLSFSALPLGKMIAQFSDMTGKGQVCLMDTLSEDFKKLASVLASAVKIPVRLLEALYIFSEQEQVQGESFSFDQECTKFVKLAVSYLSGINSFRGRIPVSDFVRFSCRDILWEPLPERQGEDWFKLFKNAWKLRFEKRFSEWMKLHDRYMLKKRALSFLGCAELPSLEFIPWEASWVPLKFRREVVFLFLKAFFSGVYPKQMSKVLKVILVEGDFYRRENLVEFTDAFNVLEHQKQDIADFEQRLSPKGDLGEGFSLALTEKMGTHNGKTRLEHLMMTVESEADVFYTKTLSALQSMDSVIGGILDINRGGPYETLANLSVLQGIQNDTFRSDLSSVRAKIQEAIDILTVLSSGLAE